MLPPIHVIDRHVVPAGGEASHTFANIDDLVAAWDIDAGVTSRHLVIITNGANSAAVNNQSVKCRFNGDAGANYNWQFIQGAGAAASAARGTGDNEIQLGDMPGANTANGFGGSITVIPHAFNALNHKISISYGGAIEVNVQSWTGRWANNNPITSILLFPGANNFIENTILILAVVDERWAIDEQILSGSDDTFTFSDIPQGDGDLMAIGYLRSSRAAVDDNVDQEINDDAVNANYARQLLQGQGAAAGAFQGNDQIIGRCSGDNATANVFGALVATYSQYSKPINQPHVLCLSGFHETSGPTSNVRAASARRDNVAAITKLLIKADGGPDFKDGSGMWLYYLPSRRELIERREFVVDGLAKGIFQGLDEFKDAFEALIWNIYARTDRAGAGDVIDIEINDDGVAANYDFQRLFGDGAVVTASQSGVDLFFVTVPGDTAGANEFGGGCVIAPAYCETDRHKHFINLHGQVDESVYLSSHRWESLAAITKLELLVRLGTAYKAGSFIEESGVVPLDTVIRRRKDKIASNRDDLMTTQTLKQIGRAWRH